MNESIKKPVRTQKHPCLQKMNLFRKKHLDTILEAGKYSPSGMGQQSTLMVVTQDPELIARLS